MRPQTLLKRCSPNTSTPTSSSTESINASMRNHHHPTTLFNAIARERPLGCCSPFPRRPCSPNFGIESTPPQLAGPTLQCRDQQQISSPVPVRVQCKQQQPKGRREPAAHPTWNREPARRSHGGEVPASGGEGGRRDGVDAGDRPRHRPAPRPGGRRRHLLPQAVPVQGHSMPGLQCVFPSFTVLLISDWDFSWVRGSFAEERGRGGGGAQGQGDRRGRGRLPRLRRTAAHEPHRHGRQGQSELGEGFKSFRCLGFTTLNYIESLMLKHARVVLRSLIYVLLKFTFPYTKLLVSFSTLHTVSVSVHVVDSDSV